MQYDENEGLYKIQEVVCAYRVHITTLLHPHKLEPSIMYMDLPLSMYA